MRAMSSQQHFAGVPRAEIPRSSFDRSFGHKTTFNAGRLIPILVDEALPGDTFNVRMTGFARLATPLHPIMDNLYMDTHFFAVPVRLVWDNFQKFCGEQVNPGDSTDYLIPQLTTTAVTGEPVGTTFDYMGIPTDVPDLAFSSLFNRAYNLIWNEWFRDQNLQNSRVVDRDDGPDAIADYNAILPRGKRHDYFTSCLPWPQKGDAVDLPLGSSANVLTSSSRLVTGAQATMKVAGSVDGAYPIAAWTGGANAGGDFGSLTGAAPTFGAGAYPTNLYADLSTATAATINQLRQAFQIQRMLERDARGGSRYTEIIRSHFGVVSPDARLQRPEFLGGGTSRVVVSAVPQTSATDVAVTPQGNLAAIGTAVLHGHGFVKSFTEHTIIIGLVSVRADLTYQQGLNRMFSRRTRYDFYWPALSHIGEQAVLRKEIFATGSSANDDVVFGYQERFAEYRYKPSQVTCVFRSSFAQSLDSWHLAQDFSAAPVLDDTFIRETPPIARIVAVDDEDAPQFLFDSSFRMICARPMPVYGVPGFIDHF